jgi:hypothetical protein
MSRLILILTCVFAALPLCVAPVRAADLDTRPHIDVVFAIDCSGSMGGVINTAKQKIWSIVNEIAKAKPTPVLRIGLHGYGNGERTFRNFPLTDDLDQVYADLMTFKDEGWGSEYVGLSIQKTTQEMDWKDWEKAGASNVLRVLYVVGNETAEQGPISYKTTAPIALNKQIYVNAIYCGYSNNSPRVLMTPSNAPLPIVPNQSANATRSTSIQQKAAPSPSVTQNQPQNSNQPTNQPTSQRTVSVQTLSPSALDEIETWKELARLGGGEFSQIAATGGGVTIPTPFDKEFMELNTKLNGTYIAYGARGRESVLKQVAQDTNALVVGGAANLAARTQAKGGAIYNNRTWDLVDASKEKDFDLAKIPKEQLPAEMQNMTPEQQKQFIATKDKERAALQKQIGELGRKREEFVQAELKKNNVNLDQALDEQILRTIRNQATNRGFKF